jgi:hypothetical protein
MWHKWGEKRNAYSLLVGKPEGGTPLGRPRHTWENNIKMDLREIGRDGVELTSLAQDRDKGRALVNAVMNVRVPGSAENYQVALQLAASPAGLTSI